ncbi:MAG TPA: hypothetical protein PLZ51_19555, partial [Aggregatilineales bacterium]|nr:hypothetical protein [Aggregatilineales bacterium]
AYSRLNQYWTDRTGCFEPDPVIPENHVIDATLLAREDVTLISELELATQDINVILEFLRGNPSQVPTTGWADFRDVCANDLFADELHKAQTTCNSCPHLSYRHGQNWIASAPNCKDSNMTIVEILEQAQQLSRYERKELVKLLVDMLDENNPPKRSITELRGLGKEIWEGIDAQDYVNQIRSEWDERP